MLTLTYYTLILLKTFGDANQKPLFLCLLQMLHVGYRILCTSLHGAAMIYVETGSLKQY